MLVPYDDFYKANITGKVLVAFGCAGSMAELKEVWPN